MSTTGGTEGGITPGTNGDPLPSGARLGDFEVEFPIGRGGMGTVYRAKQLSLGGRAVALKVHTGFGPDEAAEARFRREALIAAAIRHPHLAAVHGFGEAHGRRFYAMELVEGPSARQVLERLVDGLVPRTPELRRRLVAHAADLADALAELHRHGLVHRDVKPGNVLFRADGDALPEAPAVLVDFGLARSIAGGAGETRSISGTRDYAAPEQLQGLRVDARADVFSLGATLHDLLAARLPDRDPEPASLGRPPIEDLVPGIDRDLAAIVGMAVDPKPEWRYPDAAAMRDDLRAWLAGEPVAARRLGTVERGRRWVARYPDRLLRLILASAAVTVAVIVLALLTDALRSTSRAERAADRGDLAGLHRALADLPTSWLGRALLSGPARGAAASVAAEPDGALSEIAALAAEDDADGALLRAAIELKTRKAASDPLVRRYFLDRLRPGPLDARDSAQRATALGLAARIYYEAPDQDASSVEASADFRDRALVLLEDQFVDPLHRMYALTVLSGCGTEAEVPRLLEWAARHPAGSEELSLALQCLERLLRRGHSCGFGARIDFERAWELASAPVSLCLGVAPESAVGFRANTAALEFLEALVLLHRAQGGVDLSERVLAALPEGRRNGVAQGVLAEKRFAFRCLAAAQSPIVRADLAAAATSPFVDWLYRDPEALGRACGFYADAALTESVRSGGGSADWDDAAFASFEHGLAEAFRLAHGAWPERQPDADTHLGFVPAGGLSLPSEHFTAHPVVDNVSVQHSVAESSIAEWEFRLGRCIDVRAAAGLATEQCDIGRDEPEGEWFLRLSQPRVSIVHLAFDVTAVDAYRDRALLLVHQLGSRPYFPYRGRVILDVDVDGSYVGSIAVTEVSGHETTVELPAAVMGAGRRAVSLRLGAQSTTTYRLHWAGIR